MINPTPVTPSRSPYGTSSSGSRPTTIKSAPPNKPPRRFGLKRFFGLSLVLLLVASGTYAYAYYAGLKDTIIIDHQGDQSSVLSLYSNNQDGTSNSSLFRKAGDGRFNMVMVGIGGNNHPGGALTDSIQVMSLDPTHKKLGITSIPRDLYVNIPNYGYSKINAAYQAAEQRKKGDGAFILRKVVGEVLGVNVSNFIMIDFSGAKDLVNTLGGIDVNVPKAIYDPYFPDDATVGYSPFSIKAGLQHMDGNTALRYARSRETTSDFDRSARQQLVISAMKKKALSLGTLSNPATVLKLMTDLGQHVKTDMQPDEIKTFATIYKEISAENTTTQVLDTSATLGLLSSSSGTSAGYISYPTAGYGKYSDIHDWFQKNNQDPYITKEEATITVAAGSGTTTKQLAALVASLNDYGFKAVSGGTRTNITKTTLYRANSQKSISNNYLGTYFGTSAESGKPLSSGSDFEVIYVATKK